MNKINACITVKQTKAMEIIIRWSVQKNSIESSDYLKAIDNKNWFLSNSGILFYDSIQIKCFVFG